MGRREAELGASQAKQSVPVHEPGISSKELIRYLFPDHLLLPWPAVELGEEQVAGLCPGYLLVC